MDAPPFIADAYLYICLCVCWSNPLYNLQKQIFWRASLFILLWFTKKLKK